MSKREVTLEHFNKEVSYELKKKMNYANVMSVPRLDKVIFNCGLSEAKNNKNLVTEAIGVMEKIAGQKVVMTYARKSIAAFKLREGMPIGAKVTLRRDKMYDFLTRLIHIYIPRFRDFRGLSDKSIDRSFNYTLGINDMRVFPEVVGNVADNIPGVSITFVTTAKSREESYALLGILGFPFKISQENK